MKEKRLAASRCDRAETRGADETDVRRSMELLSAQMVIYPNAIVDHHFDELNFLSRLVVLLVFVPAHHSGFHSAFMMHSLQVLCLFNERLLAREGRRTGWLSSVVRIIKHQTLVV